MKIKEGGVMDIENFIAEFKKTFVYDILSQTLSDEQLFERVVDGDSVLWFKEQTRQMWLMWEKAKAQAVQEGFVLVEKAKLMQIIGSVSMIEPITRGNPYMDSVKRELTAITDVVKTVIEAQEPAND